MNAIQGYNPRSMFPREYAKLDKLRKDARSRPLTDEEASRLLAMRWNGKPVFDLDSILSEEWKGVNGLRPMNKSEADMLIQFYEEMHARTFQSLGNNKGLPIEGARSRDSPPKSDLVSLGRLSYGSAGLVDEKGTFKPLTPQQASIIYSGIVFAKYLVPTPEQANMLYCDIHSRY